MDTNTVKTSTTDLDDLVIEFASARSIANALRHDVENPQCGKPGLGFKAAKKKRVDLLKWEANQAAAANRIREWVGRNRPSADRRQRRMQMVNDQIPGFFSE